MSHLIKVPPLRVVVLYESRLNRKQIWTIERDKGDTAFLLREGALKEPPLIDAPSLLQSLLEIRSETEALTFLQDTGFTYFSGRVDDRCQALYSELREIQSLVKDAAVLDVAHWPSLKDKYLESYVDPLLFCPKFEIAWLARPPAIWCKTPNALEAIGTVLRLQKLNGEDFRHCSRADCDQIYRVASHHERKFCSPACAHLVAVRQSRALSRSNKRNRARMSRTSNRRSR
jgi:hypothetical protein